MSDQSINIEERLAVAFERIATALENIVAVERYRTEIVEEGDKRRDALEERRVEAIERQATGSEEAIARSFAFFEQWKKTGFQPPPPDEG